MDESEIKELLLREDEEFRRTFEEHQSLDREIDMIRKKAFPTEAETLNERELKKRKLALKDKMYRIMAAHAKSP